MWLRCLYLDARRKRDFEKITTWDMYDRRKRDCIRTRGATQYSIVNVCIIYSTGRVDRFRIYSPRSFRSVVSFVNFVDLERVDLIWSLTILNLATQWTLTLTLKRKPDVNHGNKGAEPSLLDS
jgi:hypothetical protein